MRLSALILIAAVLAVVAYVRVAPSDPARWHLPVQQAEDRDFPNGAVRVIPGDAALLERADVHMRSLPRTRVLAGSLVEKRITYVTRTAVFGFPDFTTVELSDGHLKAFARLRFGKSDLGVNRQRLERLLAALQG